jgi:hypothetical protein
MPLNSNKKIKFSSINITFVYIIRVQKKSTTITRRDCTRVKTLDSDWIMIRMGNF